MNYVGEDSAPPRSWSTIRVNAAFSKKSHALYLYERALMFDDA